VQCGFSVYLYFLYKYHMAITAVSIKPGDRARVLIANRQAKMAQSAHAYVRGNTLHFYEWLKRHSSQAIPEGPPVWICGDCHVGNIGPLADSEGKIEIQIRDLDQAVVGNPAHDLVRLALSLATAARGSDLPGVTVASGPPQASQRFVWFHTAEGRLSQVPLNFTILSSLTRMSLCLPVVRIWD
jgi:aminoglycoside phosphotransferase (APT) family kinase protein